MEKNRFIALRRPAPYNGATAASAVHTGERPWLWIVNPEAETITVLRLEEHAYVEHGTFSRGAEATSALLSGFEVGIDAVFDVD